MFLLSHIQRFVYFVGRKGVSAHRAVSNWFVKEWRALWESTCDLWVKLLCWEGRRRQSGTAQLIYIRAVINWIQMLTNKKSRTLPHNSGYSCVFYFIHFKPWRQLSFCNKCRQQSIKNCLTLSIEYIYNLYIHTQPPVESFLNLICHFY